MQEIQGARGDHDHGGGYSHHGLVDHGLPRSRLWHAHLKFMSPIVDDQSIEQTQGIHADQYRRFVQQLPLLEYVYVREGDARVDDLYGAECDRGHGYELPILNVLGRSDDLVALAPEQQRVLGERMLQSEIGDGRLTARIDDRLHA